MIACIVPLSRPEDLQNARRNFARQTFAEKRLYVVSNGPARGMTPYVSDAHQSHAMNEGLRLAKQDGCVFWAKMDGDDYYGPEYLAEQVGAFAEAGVGLVGKSDSWIYFEDLSQLVLRKCQGESRAVQFLHGHTLCGRIQDPFRFARFGQRWGEDAQLCVDVKLAGAGVVATSRSNTCYIRRSDRKSHTYPMSSVDFMAYSLSEYWCAGRWSKQIVNGVAKPSLVWMPRPEMDIERNPTL